MEADKHQQSSSNPVIRPASEPSIVNEADSIPVISQQASIPKAIAPEIPPTIEPVAVKQEQLVKKEAQGPVPSQAVKEEALLVAPVKEISSLAPRPIRSLQSLSIPSHYRKTKLLSNFFTIKVGKPFHYIHIYAARFEPVLPHNNSAFKAQVMELVRRSLSSSFGESVAISGNQFLSVTYSQIQQLAVEVEQAGVKYRANVRMVKSYDLRKKPELFLNFLNNTLKNLMARKGFVSFDFTGKYFDTDPKTMKSYPQSHLRILSGYKSSFLDLEAGYFLRVEPIKKIVQTHSVLSSLKAFYRGKDAELAREEIKGELIGKRVIPNYGKLSVYKVTEVIFGRNLLTDHFQVKEETISFVNYYKRKYGLEIREHQQPLLKVENPRKGNTAELLLVPEFCIYSGISVSLDERMRREVSGAVSMNSGQKRQSILGLMKSMREEVGQLGKLDIRVGEELAEVDAQTIPRPLIHFGDKKRMELRSDMITGYNNFLYSNDKKLRCLIFYHEELHDRDIDSLKKSLKEIADQINLNIRVCGTKNFDTLSEDFIKRYLDKYTEEANFVLALLKETTNAYKLLKRTCKKIHTQCLRVQSLRSKNFKSILTKVVHQMSAKLGNIAWKAEPQGENCRGLSSTLLAAFDSCDAQSKTVASVCLTHGSSFTRIQSGFEVVKEADKYSSYGRMLVEQLPRLVKEGKRPEEIVLFLNSVSRDQVAIVQEQLVELVKRQTREAFPDCAPRVTAVMVDTRTSEKFFAVSGAQVGNPEGGTVVMGTVTEGDEWFMLSQTGNQQKSSVPSRYKLLEVSSKLERHTLAELVYSQCFNYCNWSGAIKIPGVMQYAKKCAKFAAEVLGGKGELSEKLTATPYFV